MKKTLKKLIVTVTAAGMVFSSIPTSVEVVTAAENTKTEGITQEKIDAANDAYNNVDTKVEFLSMSDTEFGFAGGGTDAAAIQQKVYEGQNPIYKRIRDWADAKNFTVEGIMNNGDVIGANESEYYDCLAGNKARVQGAYLAVEQVFTENFGDEAIVMLANGNHDIADVMGETFETKHKDDGVWYFGDSSMEYVGNFHVKINGYDFITLDNNGKSTFGYGGQRNGYQDFLKQTLQEISSAEDYDPAKPIFVQAHSGYQGTTLGGQWAGVYDMMGMDVQTILSDYPQAVLFSAHTHYPVEEEAAIYQKNFTFVENGSMNYIYKDVAGDFIEGGYLTTGNASMPEKTCNFISVLEDGKTVIRRFDVSNERWIGMPWVIDTSNEKEGFTYTDDKRSTAAPWFTADAEIHVADVTGNSLTFGFDQAEDDELVNHYQVTIIDTFTGKPAVMNVRGLGAEKLVTGTFRALSRYYYRPNTMQFEISGLEEGKIYSAEIYAVDDFGNKSEQPLTGTFQTDGTLSFPDVEGGVTLPENIAEGKYFQMNFEDSLKDEITGGTGAANGNISYTESYRSDMGKAVKVGGGSGDYINLGKREEWNLGTDKDITINFWIKVNACNGYGSILSNKNWTNWYRKGINIAPEGSNTSKLEFTLGDDTAAGGVYATGQVPQYKGTWHMMTFTVDRTNQTASTYMDGKLYAQTSLASVKDMTSGLDMLIGVDGGKAYGATGFDMDALEMWSRPLSEEDIQTYYNVMRDAGDLITEALYYAEYRLNQMVQNAENQYYDEVLAQNLKVAMENAKETASIESFLNLKDAVKKVEEQPVRYQIQTTSENGTVSPQSQIVNQGENAVFILIPDSGYQVEESTVTVEKGCTYSLEGNKLIVENITSSSQVTVAFKEATGEKNYTIEVVNGTGSGKFVYNTEVMVTADSPADGMKFAGWRIVEADGTEREIISVQPEYRFYVSNDVTLKAVYVNEGVDVEEKAQVMATNVITTKRTDGKYDVKFVGQIVLPKGYRVKEAGLVWSTKADKELVLGNDLKPTYITKISNTNQFSVTIKGLPAGKSLRGKIFATVVDAEGNETVIYSQEGMAEAK